MKKTKVKFPGKFITPEKTLIRKLKAVKALIFDWDGVFNNGEKSSEGSSAFNEVDSMGSNLLRYSYFLNNGKAPVVGIISGEKNQTSFYFSKRECFHYCFFKMPNNKRDALRFICEQERIKPEEVLFVFDDVLDLPLAEVCGARFLVNQRSNPLFTEYCVRNKLADYITGSRGGEFAVRECAELIMYLNGNYDKVITQRKDSTNEYKKYLEQRQKVRTKFFTSLDGNLAEIEI